MMCGVQFGYTVKDLLKILGRDEVLYGCRLLQA